MYTFYGEYQINKTKTEYILILSNHYPKDKGKFKKWRIAQLKAVYINFLKMRDRHNEQQRSKGTMGQV